MSEILPIGKLYISDIALEPERLWLIKQRTQDSQKIFVGNNTNYFLLLRYSEESFSGSEPLREILNLQILERNTCNKTQC